MNNRLEALRVERVAVLEFFHDLTPGEWDAPSRCAGWSVKGVLSHMSAIFHGCFTPWFINLVRTREVEQANDRDVERRISWTPEQVLREYEVWSARYLRLPPVLAATGLERLKVPVGELGRYPLGLIPAALTFDHHLHLRHDVATALGRPVAPIDDKGMAVALEWMIAGLPQMCRESMTAIDRPVELNLSGPGADSWVLVPGKGELLEVRPGGSVPAAAAISGNTEEFALWATHRTPWRENDVKIDGDTDLGTRFLDALKIV